MKRTSLLILFAAGAVLAAAPLATAVTIVGTPGDDTLVGTDRRDFIYGRAGDDSLSGGGGGDFLFGGRGRDALDGGAGPDFLLAGGGVDSLEGGEGNDVLRAGADDGARDVADCGGGADDSAVIRAGDVAVDCEHVRVLAGTGHRPRGQVIKGTRGDDSLTGTEGRDFIFGLAGDDSLAGLGGADFLFGGRGSDTLEGGEQGDFAWGGSGRDRVSGGTGPDALYGGAGLDRLWGGTGDDRLFAVVDDGAADELDCGDGSDRAVIRPGDTALNCEIVRVVP